MEDALELLNDLGVHAMLAWEVGRIASLRDLASDKPSAVLLVSCSENGLEGVFWKHLSFLHTTRFLMCNF